MWSGLRDQTQAGRTDACPTGSPGAATPLGDPPPQQLVEDQARDCEFVGGGVGNEEGG